MDMQLKVSGRIAKPVREVFEAVADPDQLSRYFTTGGAKGRLEAGATVSWDFHDFPGAFPVGVPGGEPNRRIVLRWEAGEREPGQEPGTPPAIRYKTTVTIEFEPLE